ncbi:putative permease [Sulfurimonas gotlandica GD1]|uniref:Putative permease n=1 Tax=Sulfurimonas gotlandica (strain DSM 19862 / JCM 16533 / GD1) TaxID=929558 RepID=B6BLV1_SULGG|nr:permease [Sulfurimonas gotlandica]EDZ61851.1 permease [Sulfurimonas gotlandica GD1]EHP29477.1 putative permease [Sulfurimonas gotlandica GD1]
MWKESVDYLTNDILKLEGHLGEAINFFIYDTVKIWFLLITIIFAVSYLRTHFNTEYVRAHLQGKSQFYGNVLASLFGIVTPFCSCSAIPLFLGFIQARIPLGVTFSFLISSPMNNEIAIALLFGLFGWKVTAIYIGFGLLVAILGGYFIGRMNMEKYILMDVKQMDGELEEVQIKLTQKERVKESYDYTLDIFKKIYLYVLVGVGIGAVIHGYIPADFIASYTGADNPFAVIIAVVMGIPMYSNAAGVMPLVEVLTGKGMLLGTALSFMMAVTALSLPEAMILKRILHVKLIALFFGIVGSGIIAIGYIFNFIL